MNRKITPIPEPIAQLERQFDEFRSTHATRTKLPEPLWQAAVELARQHGVHAVAHPLRLDYMGLRRRLDESHSPQPKTAQLPEKGPTKPAFVELVARHPATLDEFVIEFESSRDGKMRIQWKAAATPDWSSLLRAWRETGG
ncbi:MAG TPA: hypothetical protein VM120_10880 [Bryobacteraceae bacterium]|nr:hypothetical protein [Bryobacteraceae bacterium]